MGKILDITGMRFGRLVALAFVERTADRKSIWQCQCDCGALHKARLSNLRTKQVQSCGCHRREVARNSHRTHGKRYSSEYRSWMSMKNRCLNPKYEQSQYYSDLDVYVCPRWIESFSAFYEDLGPKPTPKHSIDRWPDPNGNYEPGNCRWATPLEQRHNRR